MRAINHTKNRKSSMVAIILCFVAFTISSCLKDNNIPTDPDKSDNVIQFLDNGGADGSGVNTNLPLYPQYTFNLTAQSDTAGFDAILSYGPKETAPQDITISLVVNKAALDSFNNAEGTTYICPDSTVYSFPNSVTISKGQSQAYAHIVIKKTASFNTNADYALPLSISASSYGTISTNFGSEINTFTLK